MATVEPYATASGRRYRVRYRKPDHTQTTKRGFKTKKEADLFLASVELGKAAGTYIDPSHARMTVGAAGAAWLASQTHLKPSSVAVVESAWRLHVEPAWGRVPVGDVRHSDVQSWIARLSSGDGGNAKPKSPALVHRCFGVLAGILDAAVKDRRIPSNPGRGVGLPRKVSREHVYLSHQQVDQLARAAGEHATLLRVLAYTGLRWGEVSGLRVGDVDLDRRRITVSVNAVLVGGKVVVGTPKTHKRRAVPFPAFLGAPLAQLCADRPPSSLLFPDKSGGHLTTPTVRENSWFDKSLRHAELEPMTVHDLRHTAASLAVSAGANVKAVQRMLGHASAAMTLDTYSDLFDDDLDTVAARLDEAALRAGVVIDV
ncbi:tyrosine-type recombinase/integrase [Agromyces aureus]|uniref:Integrase n=1 Tax=Agromyces aureus TaxID=453304 RepID=A0A191WBT1_9MICO|nr:tyrosine-type recombinase/integrase [Agromyces aureus]ANJ25716.1 integrase [Agromyces aureus]